jgi:hypothetical protein
MWQSIDSSMWTVIESNLGIICASMPAFKQPLSIVFPWLFAKVTGTEHRVRHATSSGERRPHTRASKHTTARSLAGETKQATGAVVSTIEHERGSPHDHNLDPTDAYVLQDMESLCRKDSQDPILRDRESVEKWQMEHKAHHER